MAYLNGYLAYDGLELVAVQKGFVLRPKHAKLVESESRLITEDPISREFIEEQLEKCARKLEGADFDGAITNSRSLLEAVLLELARRTCKDGREYDGDIGKLYKRVHKAMNLDPAAVDLSESLREVLSGLISAVSGLGRLRNKLGDAHVRKYKARRHHAKLAVNAARTVSDFLIDSFEYQKSAGRLKDSD